MKDAIIDVAEERNDNVATRVKLHHAFLSDLPSAGCKYHVRCYSNSMKVPKYADLSTSTVDEDALKQVIECMKRNMSTLWNRVELHSLYSELGGKLARHDMFSKLTDCISKDVTVINVDGCATIVGFRAHIGHRA